MCNGENCPLKENCYRYTAEPNPYRQSYFKTPPYNKEEDKCKYLYPMYTTNVTHTPDNK